MKARYQATAISTGGTHTGTFEAAAGATLRLGNGTHNLNAGSNVSAATGTVSFAGATVNVNDGYNAGTTAISAGTANFNTGTHTTGTLNFSGGTLAGTGWHSINSISLSLASGAVNASKIYGSLALVPLFMASLYMIWLTELFGAQVAYAFQNRDSYLQEKLAENVNQRGREFVALRLMTCIGQRFQRSLPPATVQEMSRELGVPSKLVQQVLQTLLAARLVVVRDITRAKELGADVVLNAREIDAISALKDLTRGEGVDAALDCTGQADARLAAVRSTRTWGTVCFVGEGGSVTLDVSPDLLRRQLTLVASWTFSTVGQEECARFIADRRISLGRLLTHRYRLDEAAQAYKLFDTQTTGKGVFVFS